MDFDNGISDGSADDKDQEMNITILKAQQRIQPILHILKQAFFDDNRLAEKRQLDFVVEQFMKDNPQITPQNFYEKKYDLERTIKDARCFLRHLNVYCTNSISVTMKSCLSHRDGTTSTAH
jgi:hypothetical protein